MLFRHRLTLSNTWRLQSAIWNLFGINSLLNCQRQRSVHMENPRGAGAMPLPKRLLASRREEFWLELAADGKRGGILAIRAQISDGRVALFKYGRATARQ